MHEIAIREIKKYLGSIPGRVGRTFVIKQVNQYIVAKIQGSLIQSILQYNIYLKDAETLNFSSVCTVIYRNDTDKSFDNSIRSDNRVKVDKLIETNHIRFICINSVTKGSAEKPEFLEDYQKYTKNDFSYMEIEEPAAEIVVSEYTGQKEYLPMYFVKQELVVHNNLVSKALGMPWCLPSALASNLTVNCTAEDIAEIISGTTWDCIEAGVIERLNDSNLWNMSINSENYAEVLGEYAHHFTSQHCIKGLGDSGVQSTIRKFIEVMFGYNSKVINASSRFKFSSIVNEIESGNVMIVFLERDRLDIVEDARHVISLKAYSKETNDLWFMDSNGRYDSEDSPGGNYRILAHFEDKDLPFDLIYNPFINYYKLKEILYINKVIKVNSLNDTIDSSISSRGLIQNNGMIRNIDKRTEYWNSLAVPLHQQVDSIKNSVFCTLALTIRAMESDFSVADKTVNITPYDIYKIYGLRDTSANPQLIHAILRLRRYGVLYTLTKSIDEIKAEIDTLRHMILVYNRYESKDGIHKEKLDGTYTLFIAGYSNEGLIAYTLSTEGKVEKLMIPYEGYKTIVVSNYICSYVNTISNIVSPIEYN